MNRHLKHFSLLPSTGASQKLNLSSPHRRKRYASSDDDLGKSTGFSGAIHRNPPPMPPALLRRIGVKEVTGVGKALSKEGLWQRKKNLLISRDLQDFTLSVASLHFLRHTPGRDPYVVCISI
ncbi:hypothetical protein RUM44_012129 [Polyplax serrata]|uniref:Uncharacterized protein n=1 Tax=Polyplax serrata TaxID=468196 RepID=A0ABR1BCK2_POLSC